MWIFSWNVCSVGFTALMRYNWYTIKSSHFNMQFFELCKCIQSSNYQYNSILETSIIQKNVSRAFLQSAFLILFKKATFCLFDDVRSCSLLLLTSLTGMMFWDSPILSQIPSVPSFYCWIALHCMDVWSVVYPFTSSWIFAAFHVLSFINAASMNIDIDVTV